MVTRPDFPTTRPENKPRRALIYSLTPIDIQELAKSVPIIPEEIDVLYDSKAAKVALSTDEYSCVIINNTSMDPSASRVSQYAMTQTNLACRMTIELNCLPNLEANTWRLGEDHLFHLTGKEKDALTIPLCSIFQPSTSIKWVKKVQEQFNDARNRLGDKKFRTILLIGSAGTCKLSLAQIAHARSSRRANPFIYANCKTGNKHDAGVFESFKADKLFRMNIESMMAQAQGGTIYFHEIDKLHYSAIKVLAGILEKGTFTNADGKTQAFEGAIICSTRDNIDELVAKKECPPEIVKIMSGYIIRIPSLLDNPDDVPEIAAAMLKSICAMSHIKEKVLTNDAKEELAKHVWRKNLRELYHILSSTLNITKGKRIKRTDLYFGTTSDSIGEHRKEADRIMAMLEICKGDKKMTAQRLDVSRKTLYSWLAKYNIPKDYGQPTK